MPVDHTTINSPTLISRTNYNATHLLTGSGGIPSGTSNPGSPSTGDLFWRTDLAYLIYYDGTRWLTVNEYNVPYTRRHVPSSPATITTTMGTSAPLTAGNDWWCTRIRWLFFIATTLNGSNYWTFTWQGTTLTTISGYSANLWYGVDVTVNAAYTNADLSINKVASPGGVTANAEIFGRRIVT